MKNSYKNTARFLVFSLLTILTQIGGIIYILTLVLCKRWPKTFGFKKLFVFTGLYLFATLVIVPLVAPVFGREKVKNSQRIKPANYISVLLNRNYVRPQLNQVLSNAAKKLETTNIQIHYLDANFPFINNFALLPHISHKDGKKIDLSLIYQTKQGIISSKQKSISGYGFFEDPTITEYNAIQRCFAKGYFQYDYPKYLTLGKINKDLIFSKKGTKKLLQTILEDKNVAKIFIEPHLKTRMGLKHSKIRYHGCKAVRHDDHIHLQIH